MVFAQTVTRKVKIPKPAEPNDLTAKKTVMKVIAGTAHFVKNMAVQQETVSGKKQRGLRAFAANVENNGKSG